MLCRIHAVRSPQSDIELYNVEYSPIINYVVYHSYDMLLFPVDTQNIVIAWESWMTVSTIGQIRLRSLKEAASAVDFDVKYKPVNSDSLVFKHSEALFNFVGIMGNEFSTATYTIQIQRTNYK